MSTRDYMSSKSGNLIWPVIIELVRIRLHKKHTAAFQNVTLQKYPGFNGIYWTDADHKDCKLEYQSIGVDWRHLLLSSLDGPHLFH